MNKLDFVSKPGSFPPRDLTHGFLSSVYDACGKFSSAAAEFLECLSWQQAMASAIRDKEMTTEKRIEFGATPFPPLQHHSRRTHQSNDLPARELGDRLFANESWKEAATVFARYAGDKKKATSVLIEGRQWTEAWNLALDAPESIPSLESELQSRAMQYSSEATEATGEMMKITQTIRDILAQPVQPLVPQQDTRQREDDAVSSVSASSRGGGRKRSKKPKPDARVIALQSLLSLMPTDQLQSEVGSALRILFQLGHISESQQLQRGESRRFQ